MATITSATWLTEKYAMGDFKSIWRKHMGLVIIILRKDSFKEEYAMEFARGVSIIVICGMMEPPSLSGMAARTMVSAMEASICAFGNHRWRPYRGILTVNAIMNSNHRKTFLQEVAGS